MINKKISCYLRFNDIKCVTEETHLSWLWKMDVWRSFFWFRQKFTSLFDDFLNKIGRWVQQESGSVP